MNLGISKESVETPEMRTHTASWLRLNILNAEDVKYGEQLKLIRVLGHWQDDFAVEYSPALDAYRIREHSKTYGWCSLEKVLENANMQCFRDNEVE